MMQSEYRALVVDDEQAVRTLAQRALSDEGFHCDGAADGVQAAMLLDKARFDLVVTDLRMPRENGHALASKILARSHSPVVVILTAVLEPTIAQDLLARGADEIAFKPVDYRDFARKLRRLVEVRARQPERNRKAQRRDGWLGWFSRRFQHLTPEQCLPALELLDAEGPLSLRQLRDRVAISLALQGLSPTEISGLTVNDLQLTEHSDSVSVVRKDGVRLATRLSYQTAQCIRDYLQSADHRGDGQAFLLQPLPHETSAHDWQHVPPSTVESVLTQYVLSVK